MGLEIEGTRLDKFFVMLVLTHSRKRSGGPLYDMEKMLKGSEIRICSYADEKKKQELKKKSYVLLDIDKFHYLGKDEYCKRRVMYLGGFEVKYDGRPRPSDFRHLDWVVFNSEFYARIVLSKHKIKRYKVIYMLSSLPADEDNKPVLERCNIDGVINFLAIAKWYKRPFKRQRQTIHLFNEYILPKYPNALLHVIGCGKDTERKGNIILYQKDFHDQSIVNLFKTGHVNLILTPFDTGPKTLMESLYYRVPFVSSYNCAGRELIDKLGCCGKTVKLDPFIKNIRDCKKFKPMTSKKFYNKDLDYQLIMNAIDEIIDNFQLYTSWQWKQDFSPDTEAEKWANLLSS